MTTSHSASRGKVPFGQKIAFGLGMLANQMFPAALGIFMVVLVQDLKFPGWMWGILFFLPRVFDSVTDPIMGFISDNTRSVWGRRRQYVFVGALVMGLSFVVMWQLYRENGITYNFVYFLLWSFVFYLGLTLFSVPYVAMGYEMSDDFHERTSIMAVAQWIGQWAWVIAPWFWVIMYDPTWFPNADTATRTLAVWVGIVCTLLALVPAIFLPSHSTADHTHLVPLSLKNMGGSLAEIFAGFKDAFGYESFRKLCYATFLIFNSFNTVASFSFFIVVYYLFAGNAGAAGIWPTLFGSVGALVTTFLVIPTVAWLSKRVGKTNAFLLSQGVSIIGYVLLWFLMVPGKPYMFLYALPFFSFGIGGLFTIMMSMTADVCDLDELETGKRREGIFGAIYWWMVKFGFAVAGLLTGGIMTLVGFDPGSAANSESAITGLRLFYSGVPIVGTLAAMWIMRNYDLSEEKAHQITAQLEQRRAPKAPAYAGQAAQPRFPVSATTEAALKAVFPQAHVTSLDFASVSGAPLQQTFQRVFDGGLHGICFSAYQGGQKPGDTITEAQIRQRLELLRPHAQWVRVFSCTNGHEAIPRIAREMGFKTLVGAWLNASPANNDAEIRSLTALMQQGLVDIAAVGNEVLYREELTEEQIVGYIRQVKAATQGVPVGCVDAYYEFARRPALVQASDVVLANCYPYWEGADIATAGFTLQHMVAAATEAAQGKPVIVTETGWPTQGATVGAAVPSADNARTYFVKTQEWARHAGVELFYFSSFDESWKVQAEGTAGTSWGLWGEDLGFKFK